MGKVEHLDAAFVGDPVVDGAMLAPRLDEAAPAQTGEVVRDLRLRLAQPLDQLPHRQLSLVAQQLQNLHPRLVAETAEVLGDQVAAGRRFGQTERGFENGHRHLLRKYLKVLISEWSELSASEPQRRPTRRRRHARMPCPRGELVCYSTS